MKTHTSKSTVITIMGAANRRTSGRIFLFIVVTSLIFGIMTGCGSVGSKSGQAAGTFDEAANPSSTALSSTASGDSAGTDSAGTKDNNAASTKAAGDESGDGSESAVNGAGSEAGSEAGGGTTGAGTAGAELGTAGTENVGNTDNTGNTNTSPIDFETVKPNEAGKIMVVMFHRFITTYEKGDKQYTTTFGAFEQLLQRLYDMDYRLVNLNDMLAGNINVPAGKIPMVFTFDDGTPGQFSLVEGEASSGAAFKANPQSAVGVMEKFNESHPDFGLKGTFYVNLEGQPFNGSGTVADRLKYLVDEGFEIGNHTYSHINLKKATDALKIQEEIGKNIITMENLIPGYIMKTLSLPYGLPSKELQQYVAKGEYNGEAYENIGILEVGWDPSVSPVSSRFNPLKIHRVRATGIEKVESDLDWWLEELTREEQYISDGDPETVTVPVNKSDAVDKARLKGKKLVTY